MTSKLKLFAAMLVFVVASACGTKEEGKPAVPAEPPAPKATVVDTFFDWGTIRQGDVVEHKFAIRNSGTADLVIKKLKSSCGCVAVASTPGPIAAGQVGEITAKFDSAGRQGPSRKSITVLTNDPATPELKLALGGYITTDVEVTPSKLDLGEVQKGKKGSARFKILVKDTAKTKISAVKVEDPQFELKLIEGNAAADAEYEVTFLGSDALGPVMVRIDVSTEGSAVPAFKLPVNLVVVGDLQYPRSTVFFRNDDNKYEPQPIEIASRSGKTVEIKKAEDKDGNVTAEIVTAKGKKAELRLTPTDKADTSTSALRGKLVIETNSKDEPLVSIDYSVSRGKRPTMMKMGKPATVTP